jgi:pimeloyl-ACP methyl ester carboxylesterase
MVGRRVHGGLLVSAAGLTLLTMLTHGCQFRMSKSEIDSFLSENKLKGQAESYRAGKQLIHYVRVGDRQPVRVIFVHGSPGSLSAFIDYLSDSALLARAELISVDRPGFGNSNFGYAEPSLSKQSRLLRPLLDREAGQRTILVGHSLGGPVIARMAMDYPDLVDGLVLVAASIDPNLEPKEAWFRVPLSTPFLRWLVPRSFRASNDELVGLKGELEEMVPGWSQIKVPVTVIQGGKDGFVPAANADFARRMLTHAEVDFVLDPEWDHFIVWSRPELIREAVLRQITAYEALFPSGN